MRLSTVRAAASMRTTLGTSRTRAVSRLAAHCRSSPLQGQIEDALPRVGFELLETADPT